MLAKGLSASHLFICECKNTKPGLLGPTYNLSTSEAEERQRQKGYCKFKATSSTLEFQANQEYIMRCYLKENKTVTK